MRFSKAYEKGIIKEGQKISEIEGFGFNSNNRITYKGRPLTEAITHYRYSNAYITKKGDKIFIVQPPHTLINIDVTNFQINAGKPSVEPQVEKTEKTTLEKLSDIFVGKTLDELGFVYEDDVLSLNGKAITMLGGEDKTRRWVGGCERMSLGIEQVEDRDSAGDYNLDIDGFCVPFDEASAQYIINTLSTKEVKEVKQERTITLKKAIELGLVGEGTDMALFGLKNNGINQLVNHKGEGTSWGNDLCASHGKLTAYALNDEPNYSIRVSPGSGAYVADDVELLLPEKLTVQFLVEIGYFDRGGDFETMGFELGEPKEKTLFKYHPTYKGVEMLDEEENGANLKTASRKGLKIEGDLSIHKDVYEIGEYLVFDYTNQYHVIKADFDLDVDLLKTVANQETSSEEPSTEPPSKEHVSTEHTSTEQPTEKNSKFTKVGELYDGTPVYRTEDGDLIEGNFRDLTFRLMFGAKHTKKTETLFEDLETVMSSSTLFEDYPENFSDVGIELEDGTEEDLEGGLKEVLMQAFDIVLMNYDLTPKA